MYTLEGSWRNWAQHAGDMFFPWTVYDSNNYGVHMVYNISNMLLHNVMYSAFIKCKNKTHIEWLGSGQREIYIYISCVSTIGVFTKSPETKVIHTPSDHGTGISTYIYCKNHLYKCIHGQKKQSHGWIGRVPPIWEGNFSRAMLNFGRVCIWHLLTAPHLDTSILVPLVVPFLTTTALQKHSWNSRNHRTHRTPGYIFGATHLPTNHVDSHSHPKHWWLEGGAALALKAGHQIQTTNQLLSETTQWGSSFWNSLKPVLQ